MKLHTILDRTDLDYAARQAGVRFERLDESGSRTHPRKFDLLLSGNSGRGANFGGNFEAASWDQWGIFLNEIFKADPDARAAGYYEAREQFRWFTGKRFDTLTPDQQHRNHRWTSTGDHQQGCTCGAIRRWDPPRQATGSGPVRPNLRPMPLDERAALLAERLDVFPSSIGSRYESNGRYARELGDRDTDALLIEIGELVDD